MDFRFVPIIGDWTFLPQESDLVSPDWEFIYANEVTAIWLLFRPGQDTNRSTSGWSLALQTRCMFVMLYPEQADEENKINFICRPLTTEQAYVERTAYNHMESETKERYSRAVVPGTKVDDILKDLYCSGITFYRLHANRGHRFWISLALYQMDKFIQEEPLCNSRMSRMSLALMGKRENPDTGRSEVRPVTFHDTATVFWRTTPEHVFRNQVKFGVLENAMESMELQNGYGGQLTLCF
ncbi:hypothetical protein F4810DRAFT_705969 [Camillea tinctor]|nr:hypothetical protein F4810DRAFT_705969 [Camillea tinctor]